MSRVTSCALLTAGLVGWMAGPLQAQETVRSSLAGEAAAAGRKRALDTDYNVRVGPVRLKLDAGLEFEFNDNVNLADSRLPGAAGPQSDFFIRPRLDIGANWQVTQLNVLSLKIGLGYEFSLNNTRGTNVSPISISPDSEIGFDFFIGDFRINLHDRFSVENNPASQATLSNTTNYTRFTNIAGVTVLWDLNDLVLTGGYDYAVERYTGTTFQANDRNTHLLRLSAAFLLNETTTVGLQSSFSYSTYDQLGSVEQLSLTAGPFAQFQISPYTRFLVAAGVQQYESKRPTFRVQVHPREAATGASSPSAETVTVNQTTETAQDTGYYWTASIANRLNAWYSHSLSAGHERQLGLGVEYVDIDYVRYEASWKLNQQITLGLSGGFEHLNDSQGLLSESLDRWNFGLAFGYQLTKGLRAGVRYSHYTKESDLSFRDYRQNVVVFSFFYDF